LKNYVVTRPQFDDRLLFGRLVSKNGLEYRSFDYSTLICNHFSTCTSYKKVVRFRSVTPEFKTYEFVRQAPVILPHLVQLRSICSRAVKYCGD